MIEVSAIRPDGGRRACSSAFQGLDDGLDVVHASAPCAPGDLLEGRPQACVGRQFRVGRKAGMQRSGREHARGRLRAEVLAVVGPDEVQPAFKGVSIDLEQWRADLRGSVELGDGLFEEE